jgi:hypothetical protein
VNDGRYSISPKGTTQPRTPESLDAAPGSSATRAHRGGGAAWLGTIVLDSAAFDLVEIMQGKYHRIYDRAFGKDRAFWNEASPYHRLTTAPAPMLLVCSTRRDDACPQAQPFASKATKLGGRVVVLPVDMKHGEINKELGLPSDYTTTVETFMRSLGLP